MYKATLLNNHFLQSSKIEFESLLKNLFVIEKLFPQVFVKNFIPDFYDHYGNHNKIIKIIVEMIVMSF